MVVHGKVIRFMKKSTISQSMINAKKSFKVDIENGFKIIHIDPSVTFSKNLSQKNYIKRLFELYEFVSNYAKKMNTEILIEIVLYGGTGTYESLDQLLKEVKNYTKRKN